MEKWLALRSHPEEVAGLGIEPASDPKTQAFSMPLRLERSFCLDFERVQACSWKPTFSCL